MSGGGYSPIPWWIKIGYRSYSSMHEWIWYNAEKTRALIKIPSVKLKEKKDDKQPKP